MTRSPLPRRDTLQLAALGAATAMTATTTEAKSGPSTLTFKELSAPYDKTHHVAEGHTAQVLLRWGDPLFADSPAFDPMAQTPEAQRRQFGAGNDYIAFLPLPAGGKGSDSGLLCVNHEMYHSITLMPGVREQLEIDRGKTLAEAEMTAHGHTVVEVARVNGTWTVKRDSKYNRRINPLDTAMTISGPAAGHRRLRTSADPGGRRVIGTFGNCAGGVTPWGTVLIAEENIQHYFGGDPRGTAEARNHADMGLTEELYFNWYVHHPRLDMSKELNEPNRFGWMVEIDPYDPASTPVKRTALGRCKHEGAGFAFAADGRVVVYSGDDEIFQHIYKFVSAKAWDSKDRAKNRDILDDGVLHVARFEDNGTLTWLPMVFGQGPLTPANGFNDQGDVLIELRRAAKLLGATPMDRPEQVVPNPVTGTVFAALTKNSRRKQTDAVNPRPNNKFGGVIEMLPPGFESGKADHGAAAFGWRPFILAGDPRAPESGAQYHADTSADGWFANPDNVTFDFQGRIWISTDGLIDFERADGMFAADVTGPGKALSRRFFSCPHGAEMTGPCFTPDGSSLFVSVQHPGEDSPFKFPTTRWPDFKEGIPPRSSVVVVQRTDGKPIT
jgi:secreted PhoX family phosphatase